MKPAPIPYNEDARVRALRDLEVLDTGPEAEFDALVRVASMVTGTPISLISLVDSERQWFKANIGLPGASETPRDLAFCSHAILDDALLEVPDATQDVRFADNPLVIDRPDIRFYAGVPIQLSDGYRVGTLCVIDRTPRTLTDNQREILAHLAGAAAQALEGRRAIRTTIRLATELSEQHELLRVTLQSIGDAVITTGADGKVAWLNPVAEQLTGWISTQASGRDLRAVMRVERTRAKTPGGASSSERAAATGRAEHLVLTSKSGSTVSIESSESPICNEPGIVVGKVIVFRDVTEQRRLSEELTYRATHDSLTGLANRAEFEAQLQRARLAVQSGQVPGVLMFIDLDRFKLVNDTCGHAAGDRLLRQVAKMLREMVRSRDGVARLGGDEFAVLLEACSLESAREIGQRLCDRMERFRFLHEDQSLQIGTSIGIVPLDSRWDATAAIMKAADAACYAAKKDGRNRVHLWLDSDVALHALSGETQWASRIGRALDEERFVLYAQKIEPLRSASTGLHAEVLVRMIDTDGAIVLPGAFLPAAERFQLAPRIDRWVLDRSVAWLRARSSADTIARLSVNLSGLSIGDSEFRQWAVAMLSAAGHGTCRRLCLEITETAAITHLAEARKFLAEVRALGVRIALDDFGAGASSFGYLKTLVVDCLKIDGQFVRGLVDDPLDAAAVRCFVDVAQVMGLETVAEFVDRPAILALVREMGIDYAQGFFLHRPVPIDQLLGLPEAQGEERLPTPA